MGGIQHRNQKHVAHHDIYLGLITPMGCDVKSFQSSLKTILMSYGYTLEPIKLSKYLESKYEEKNGSRVSNDPLERKKELIKMGDYLREEHGPDHLAQIAIAFIYSLRDGTKVYQRKKNSRRKKAYLIDGFKHYKEVETIRSLYGHGFFLIGLYSNDFDRLQFLVKQENISEEGAKDLLNLEQDDTRKYGQKVSDSFYKSDVFIPVSGEVRRGKELSRFIDLMFGHPYHTPSRDEYVMFHAYAASLRSADLSRQVGAVISTPCGEIVAQGANDVPKFGGGQYWSDDYFDGLDQRDYVRKFDSNKRRRNIILDDIVERISSNKKFNKKVDGRKLKPIMECIKEEISNSELKDITEYGRAVHAEMAALLSMGRLGISSKGLSLFTTTYPCHNCAKHIIAAGIQRVVYVEPYPKSLATELHDDSISKGKGEKDKLFFEPFIGIGPRRFFDLFSLTLSMGDEILRHKEGRVIDFNLGKKEADPRIRLSENSIIEQEYLLSQRLFPGSPE